MPTGAFPHFHVMSFYRNWACNKFGYYLAKSTYVKRQEDANIWRKTVFKLPAFQDQLFDLIHKNVPIFCPYDKRILPVPSDWFVVLLFVWLCVGVCGFFFFFF